MPRQRLPEPLQRPPAFRLHAYGVALLAVLAGAIAACGRGGEPAPPGGVGPETVRDLTYLYEAGDGPVRLEDGAFEDPRGGAGLGLRVTLGDTAFGDLDGDGVRDGAVVLIVEPGTGQAYRYLVAVLDREGVPTPVSSVFLEDRLGILDLRIDEGLVVLDVLSHELDDPLGQPSLAETWRFGLEGETLLER